MTAVLYCLVYSWILFYLNFNYSKSFEASVKLYALTDSKNEIFR